MTVLRFVLLLGCVLAAAEAGAATVSVGAVRDNSLYESAGGFLSNGAGDYLFAGRTNHPPNTPDNPSSERGLLRRALVAFDLVGVLPPGALVTGAELRLYVSNVSLNVPFDELPAPVAVHRLEAAWGEAGSDAVQQEGAGAVAQPGDATWTEAFSDSAAWATPGGDFLAAASATTVVADKDAAYTWSGPGLVSDVSAWLADPGTNFGWIVVGDESEPLSAKRFNSRENPAVGTRPALTLAYTVIPEPGVVVCLLGAWAGGLVSRRVRPGPG